MALPRSSWRVAALGLALAVTVAALAASPAPQGQNPTVRISMQGNSIQVSPSRVLVRQGGVITWDAGTNGPPFALVVQRHGTVFPGRAANSMRGRSGNALRVPVGPRADTTTYKYTVVVYHNGQMVIEDPEIVVQPQ